MNRPESQINTQPVVGMYVHTPGGLEPLGVHGRNVRGGYLEVPFSAVFSAVRNLGLDPNSTRLYFKPTIDSNVQAATSNPDLEQEEYSFASERIVVNIPRQELIVDDVLTHTFPQTFALLAFFAQNPGFVLSKDTIHSAVWGNTRHASTDNAVETYVKYARNALGNELGSIGLGGAIRTLRGRGYMGVKDLPSRSI